MAAHQGSIVRPMPDLSAAACTDKDPGLFITNDDNDRRYRADAALRICARCPVRKPCLDYAMDNRFLLGVWGGTTWRDRWEYGGEV